MPPKRKAADNETGPSKKATTTPRLKKSKTPSWDDTPEYTNEKPKGEWARKCVDRWCLLPPYDTSISEELWEDYYNERAALDQVNSSGAPESKDIVSEELEQDTWKILRKASTDLAAVVLGSKLDDEERKKQIARTLMGSLYFLELWGNDEGNGSPREVRARTRLYSPFGVGSSIDFYYWYHYRLRMLFDGERFGTLYARSNTITEVDPENPTVCTAVEFHYNRGWKADPDAITIFDRNRKKSKGTTAAKIQSFESALFETDGWISPMKLVEILFAAGTVMHYREEDRETPESVLEKFKYFAGETDGRTFLAEELETLAELEARESSDQPVISIPQRLLLLARRGGANGSE